jgi:hypothetical protein
MKRMDEKIKIQIFNNNMKDYILMDNLYRMLESRSSILSFGINEERKEKEIKMVNSEILNTCEYCLLEVDWTKYK